QLRARVRIQQELRSGRQPRRLVLLYQRVQRQLRRCPPGLSEARLHRRLHAHWRERLQFEARLRQDSLKPGAVVTLDASLKMYDVPFSEDASVWAEVTRPDLTTMNLQLNRVADGLYSASFLTSLSGVYPCRVRCEGYFRS